MAGIGFELRKIFKERGVVSLLKGAFYSTFTVIGPMLITMLSFMVLFAITGYQHIDYESKDLLVSITLYVFVFSLIFTSPLSAVVSRYIADRIFEEDLSAIMPCYYTGLAINMALGLLACAPVAIHMVAKGGVDPVVALIAAGMFMSMLMVYYNMTFISALKEYRTIALTFLAGMAIMLVLGFGMYRLIGVPFLRAVLGSMMAGFLYIGLQLYAFIRRFFNTTNHDYWGLLPYLRRFWLLLMTNMFYILGMYAHNFVFWFKSSLSITVAGTLYSAPVYDMAAFLAMMTNVSLLIIFTVRVETNFHERYQDYCQQLLGGVGKEIVMAKNNMFQIMVKEIQYIAQVQTGLSMIIFLFLMICAPALNFGGAIMTIYPALAAGYFVIFLMYCSIIMLFYFDDGLGAALSAGTFFVVTLVVSLAATSFRPSLYGIGAFIGAFCGWTIAFFRLRYIERNINRQMYCKGDLVKRVYINSY